MALPLINGTSYSWANVGLVLFGVPVIGIVKIEYKRSQKKDNNYGSGVDPVSRGYSNKEYVGSIELYMEEWEKIIDASPNRDPLDIPPFDIPVTFGGSRVTARKHVLRAVEFMDDEFKGNQGDAKLMVTIPLIIGSIDK